MCHPDHNLALSGRRNVNFDDLKRFAGDEGNGGTGFHENIPCGSFAADGRWWQGANRHRATTALIMDRVL
jgi:hypothetical protein